MTIETLTEFLAWVTVVNMGLLLLSTIMIFALKSIALKMHSMMFNINESDLNRMYFDYLGRFKLLIIVFNIAPYIALRIIA